MLPSTSVRCARAAPCARRAAAPLRHTVRVAAAGAGGSRVIRGGVFVTRDVSGVCGGGGEREGARGR